MKAFVTSPEELKDALASDIWDIEITEPLFFRGPNQCINVSKIRPLSSGNGLSIKSAGGTWCGGTITRLHDGITPLLQFDHDRDWELRLSGLMFHNPTRTWFGPSLIVKYSQQSIFHDIRFEGFNNLGSYIGEINSCGSTFDFIQIMYAAQPFLFSGMNAVTFRTLTTNCEWGTEYNQGCIIKAGGGGGCRITDPHNEGCSVIVQDYKDGVLYEGGYHQAATVRFNNNADRAVATDGRGMVWESSSEMYIDQKKIDPIAGGFIGSLFG